MISRIGSRNLIQIRMDPDFAQSMGMTVFDRVFEQADQESLFFGEAVWRPQHQECPSTGYEVPCPDCGGTADLRDAVNTFRDTRLKMPGRSANDATKSSTTKSRRALVAYEKHGDKP